jgi:phage-related minor tail protein
LSRRVAAIGIGLADSFGAQLTGALKAAVISGKALDDILRQVRAEPRRHGAEPGLAPLQALAGNFHVIDVQARLAGLRCRSPSGGVPGRAVTPFASGGVVARSRPISTLRRACSGLMGEAAPRRSCRCSRTADGRLGVAASGGQAAGPTVVVQCHDAGCGVVSQVRSADRRNAGACRHARIAQHCEEIGDA